MTLLSIIVPVFNEALNVEPLYEAINRSLEPLSGRYSWEFVFTDNCSTDDTFERLGTLSARDARVRVYRFIKNFGFQRSILSGYRLARGDAAIQIDCDLQDPAELILDFIRLWEAGYKIVFGVRRNRPESFHLHLARRSFYRLIHWLSPDGLPRDAGDFRLIDRCVLDHLQEYHDEAPYLRGFIASLGYRQVGIPYDRQERRRGSTSFRLPNLIELAVDGIVTHSILPLRLASVVGIVLFMLTGLLGIGYIILYFTSSRAWPAGFATLAMLMLMSLAMNAIFLGIMGEYLARIYRQMKPRPLVIVDRYIDRVPPTSATRGTQSVSGIVFPLAPPGEHVGVNESRSDAV